MGCSELVILGGGFSVEASVVRRLLDIEHRGGRFALLDHGRFRVIPPEVLTDADREFLRQRRDEARSLIEYCERTPQIPS